MVLSMSSDKDFIIVAESDLDKSLDKVSVKDSESLHDSISQTSFTIEAPSSVMTVFIISKSGREAWASAFLSIFGTLKQRIRINCIVERRRVIQVIIFVNFCKFPPYKCAEML